MSAAVEPHEVEALRAAEAAIELAGIEPRDFSQPRRFSALDQALIARSINLELPTIAARLGAPLRQDVRLTLAALEEVTVDALLEGLEEPFFVAGFKTEHGQGWGLWDSRAALCAVEAVLAGSIDPEQEPRRFSSSERRLVQSILSELLEPLVRTLGVEKSSEPFELAQREEELRTVELEPGSDSRRLLIHISFDGPGGPSDVRFYVPGVSPSVAEPVQADTVPEHLEEVALEFSARLGQLEVPLSELLALEEGDVVPLGQPIGTEVEIWIEEKLCGSAHWGDNNGNLAVVVGNLAVEGSQRAGAEPDTDGTSRLDADPVDGKAR